MKYKPEVLDEKDWEKAKNVIDYDIWWNIKEYIVSLEKVNQSLERYLSIVLQQFSKNNHLWINSCIKHINI